MWDQREGLGSSMDVQFGGLFLHIPLLWVSLGGAPYLGGAAGMRWVPTNPPASLPSPTHPPTVHSVPFLCVGRATVASPLTCSVGASFSKPGTPSFFFFAGMGISHFPPEVLPDGQWGESGSQNPTESCQVTRSRSCNLDAHFDAQLSGCHDSGAPLSGGLSCCPA